MKKLGSPVLRCNIGGVVVIKLGGKALTNQKKKIQLLKQIVKMSKEERNVLVHGGGPEITESLEKIGIKSRFVNGLRYTDEKTMEFVEMLLSGKINKELVNRINLLGSKAVGLSGKDGQMVVAERIKGLGLVGKPKLVNTSLIKLLLRAGIIPVISSIGVDRKGNTLNLNADLVAGAISSALKAKRLIFLTDVPGVLDKKGKIIKKIQIKEIPDLIKKGIVSAGMLPKLEACRQALKKGLTQIVITNGKKGLDYGTEIKI